MNIIEIIWAIMEAKIEKLNPETLDQSKSICIDVWTYKWNLNSKYVRYADADNIGKSRTNVIKHIIISSITFWTFTQGPTSFIKILV